MSEALGKLMQMVPGYQVSQIIYTIVKFGFIDFLKDGSKSGEELAKLAKTNEEKTIRLLRAGASLGILSRDSKDLSFSLNDLSTLLLDGPGSLRYWVLHACEPPSVHAWTHLDEAVESNVYPFHESQGVGIFEYYKNNPKSADYFNKAMTALTKAFPIAKGLIDNYDFTNVKHVVDVGGSNGGLLVDLLTENTNLQGTCFDLPDVIEHAKANLPVGYPKVESRINYTGGSFFEKVPSGGDIYIMKFIIHDWNDEKSVEILKTVAKELSGDKKIVLLEQVLEEVLDVRGGLLDLHMLSLCDAKERTEKQYRDLFAKAGLSVTRFVSLKPTFYTAVEGVKLQ